MKSLPAIERLLAIMATLRTPGTGCAWDLAQTHESLVPYVLEEAYEVADAIARREPADLRDELGDLLLQVVFHAQLAREQGRFTFDDVARSICEKMIRRHPHVFAASDETVATSPDAVASQWERIKAGERAAKGNVDERVLSEVPVALPALTRAVKLQRCAANVGFDWGDVRPVLAKLREEIDEIEQALDEPAERRHAALSDEIGDLFFALVNLARHAGVDPESAARGANAKFERRFAFIEDRLAEQGTSPAQSDLREMDRLWNAAKAAGL